VQLEIVGGENFCSQKKSAQTFEGSLIDTQLDVFHLLPQTLNDGFPHIAVPRKFQGFL
jgi:hypothetical protein